MEISTGFCNLERLTHRTHSSKATLINKSMSNDLSISISKNDKNDYECDSKENSEIYCNNTLNIDISL